MDMQTREILRDFGVSPKTAHLPWMLQVTKGKKTFRIEVSKTTNQNAPWARKSRKARRWIPVSQRAIDALKNRLQKQTTRTTTQTRKTIRGAEAL